MLHACHTWTSSRGRPPDIRGVERAGREREMFLHDVYFVLSRFFFFLDTCPRLRAASDSQGILFSSSLLAHFILTSAAPPRRWPISLNGFRR